MEVHHHPDIRRKDLKEYILEGLMIFMAVTLGFFGENLREDLMEHSKEKEYIVSMIEDAKTDIVSFNKNIDMNKLRVLKLDTISTLCFNYENTAKNDPAMYDVVRYCIKYPDFAIPVERTMFQLKNAGGMRLIQNKNAIDSIIYYDEMVKKLVNQQDYYELHLRVLLDATEQLFNLKYFPLNHKTLRWEADVKGLASAKLMDHNTNDIISFGNKAKIFQGILIFYLVRLDEAKKHATNLIGTLKGEYDIK